MNMREILDGPITAFSIGFQEESYSELEYARAAAKDKPAEVLRGEGMVASAVEVVSHLKRQQQAHAR